VHAVTPGDDRGAVAIIVALLAVALFGFGALVIDIGNAEEVRSDAQGAVDSGALAGVQALEAAAEANAAASSGGGSGTGSGTAATSLASVVSTAVTGIVGQNIHVTAAEWAACTDADPLPDQTTVPCISYAQPGDPNPNTSGGSYVSYEVRVQFPTRAVPTTFGGLFGVSAVRVSPLSVAQAGQPPPSPCAACNPTLDDEGHPVSGVVIPRSVQTQLNQLHLTQQIWVPGSCPAPGIYVKQNLVLGDCALASGSYQFNDSTVTVNGELTLASSDPSDYTTLVFNGTGTLIVTPTGSLSLNPAPPSSSPVSSPTPTPSPTPAPVSSPPAPVSSVPGGSAPASGAPLSSSAPVSSVPVSSVPVSSPASSPPPQEGIKGVAIVFEGRHPPQYYFDLGNHFSITGSVYAPRATWQVLAPECTTAPDCMITNGVLAVRSTDFEAGRTPTVDAVPPLGIASPPASVEPHLVR
jgi:hypothetical protein